jgi:hypothetical protein
VFPAEPDAASSTHNINFGKFESRKTTSAEMELRVDPFDSYKNSLSSATGYAVSIDGGDPTPLLAPSFSYTHEIPKGFSGRLHLTFTLDGVNIADSPVTISISPDWTFVYIGAVMCVLLVVALAIFFVYQRLKSKQMKAMGASLESVQASQKKLMMVRMDLEAEKEALVEEVRLKKHSEEELQVMVGALQAVSKERQDELKEVMIDSKELKAEKLLGKGG